MEPDRIIQKIIELLQKTGKKQKELTDFLGITQNAFTDWKSGRIKSYNKHLPKIAEFFGVTVDYLLGNEKEKPAHEGELSEDIVIYHRNGKTTKRKLTQKQMEMLAKMIDAIPEED